MSPTVVAVLNVVGLIVIASCIWYYWRHTRIAYQDPSARTAKSLFMRFVWGDAGKLLLILVALIAILALIFQWTGFSFEV